ncbi:ABC transporter permease subunit [Nocardioides sp. GXZ039]|uniref:ABC transporter permease subunit n=1 Tax=Nocardioides sp. GXZ039 TaxID=3136018 RepID=UPI0030F3D1B0
MIRLIGVELTRARWRRAVLVLLITMIVAPVGLGVITILDQQPASADAYAQAEAKAAKEAERPRVKKEIAACLADPEGYGVGPADDPEVLCEEWYAPQPEWYLDYNALDLDAARGDAGLAVAVIVALLALLVGTTFIGHDWNTGSMSNQLIFESRRGRVWAAKAVAVTLVTGVIALVGTSLFWLILAARFWSADAEIPDGALLDGLQHGWRGAAVAGFAGLIGFALTMLSRSTVFTLGVLFGVAVAGSILINLLFDDPGPIDPSINVAAVINHDWDYYVQTPEYCWDGSEVTEDMQADCSEERTRDFGDGVLYLGVLGGAICAASVLSYRRRDVP